MFRISIFLFTALLLTACAGSSAYFADHPTRTSVNGIAIVADQHDRWHSWHEGIVVNLEDSVTAKQRQVTAIETASNCSVTDTAFRNMPGLTNFMTASVICP